MAYMMSLSTGLQDNPFRTLCPSDGKYV